MLFALISGRQVRVSRCRVARHFARGEGPNFTTSRQERSAKTFGRNGPRSPLGQVRRVTEASRDPSEHQEVKTL